MSHNKSILMIQYYFLSILYMIYFHELYISIYIYISIFFEKKKNQIIISINFDILLDFLYLIDSIIFSNFL